MRVEILPVDTLMIAAIITAIAALYAAWRSRRPLFFAVWRGATVVAIVIALARPVMVSGGDSRPVIAVAVDASGSVRLSGRKALFERFLGQAEGGLRQRFALKYFAFATTAGELDGPDAKASVELGSGTDIVQSLGEIRRQAGDALSGIILLSDGNHNGRLPAAGWARDLKLPVFPVVVDRGSRYRDIAVRSVRVGNVAFKNMPLDVHAAVSGTGCSGRTVNIRLLGGAEERLLAAKTLTFASDRDEQEVVLSFAPAVSGPLPCRIEAEALKDEVTGVNNVKRFELDVQRDKLRVLFICGQPGPEYAFLRHTLKNDPLIELVSFVILRNPENIALVPENDLSLIPFPVHTIFTRDLYDFDILIFENFTYQGFGFLPDYLANIGKWVTDRGGGFMMIGGRNSFGRGGWAGTPVDGVLPVVLQPEGEAFDEGMFDPRISMPRHPALAVDADETRNARFWSRVPQLDGCQELSAKPGAQVLATSPWSGSALIAVWQKGKGRVAALASNTTWRWALGSATPELYTNFWHSMVRYLGRAAENREFVTAFDRPDYVEGQPYVLRVVSQTRSRDISLRVTMIDPSGMSSRQAIETQGAGAWSVKGSFSRTGQYSFLLTAERAGARLYSKTLTQAVTPSSLREEAALDVNEELLQEIARQSGGELVSEDRFSPDLLAQKLKARASPAAAGKKPLAESPAVFMLITASILGEWVVRKRKGML